MGSAPVDSTHATGARGTKWYKMHLYLLTALNLVEEVCFSVFFFILIYLHVAIKQSYTGTLIMRA